MAAHYDTAIVPARPHKPRDKAKVEVAVLVAQRWIMARLRNRRFFSLAELNEAIRELVDELNDRVTRHLGASRRQLFEELERPALKPLPAEPYEYAEWKRAPGRARLPRRDRQALLLGAAPAAAREALGAAHRAHGRGVPSRPARRRASARVRRTAGTRRCASTCRRATGATPTGRRRGSAREAARDRPRAPRRWSRSSCASAPHPEQGFRACLGILRLARAHGRERLEAACDRALEIGARSYTSVNSILKNNLDRRRPEPATDGPAIAHANIRGPATSTEEKTPMLTHPTLDQLRALKLDGMADAFVELQAQDSADGPRPTPNGWRCCSTARLADRNTKRFQTRLRGRARCVTAKPSIEDVDYRTPRRLDKALFQQLATGTWIAEHRNLLVTGPCGVGKSWLACALGQKACRDGYTVLYARVPRLFADLELAHGDGRFARLFRTLVKADLLILDDWGPDRLTAGQRRDLMEIVEDRYGRGSTLITSQLPIDAWHEVIGEPTFADAILDRIVHNAYRLDLDGPVDAQDPAPRTRLPQPPKRPHARASEASQGRPEMTAALRIPPAPVGQQAPPTRAAASDSWRSLRGARGSLLLTTGTAYRRGMLDANHEH